MNADFEMFRGASAVFDITVTDEEDVPVDLTGAELTFTMKRRLADPDALAIVQKVNDGVGIIIDLPASGEAHVVIAPDDTAGLAFYQQKFKYDLIAVTDDRREVLAHGTITVVPVVTDPES